MEVRSSWWTFAGIMVLVGGLLNAFDGLVAITQSNYIERNIGGQLPITNNVKTWGWVALIIGVIMLLAGFGILSGANWARVFGILIASVNLIFPVRVSRSQLVLVVHDDRHRHPDHLRAGRAPRRRTARAGLIHGRGCTSWCIPDRTVRFWKRRDVGSEVRSGLDVRGGRS